jgi:hypothetical protein
MKKLKQVRVVNTLRIASRVGSILLEVDLSKNLTYRFQVLVGSRDKFEYVYKPLASYIFLNKFSI